AIVKLRQAITSGDARVRPALIRLLAESAQSAAREERWEPAAGHLAEISELDPSWCSRTPSIARAAATVLILAGRRAEAIAACSSPPHCTDSFSKAHFLWLSHFWVAKHDPTNLPAWQRAIGYLVLLLHTP